MKEILIVVSTCNRTDLTALTLTSVKAHKSAASEVLILDDASAAYDEAWLRKWGFQVQRRARTLGVGPAAKARYEQFLATEFRYLCALDNDILVCAKFDLLLLDLWHRVASEALTVVTGYHSVTQTTLAAHEDYVEVDVAGGACHFIDRPTASRILNKMEAEWPHNWDHVISRAYEKKFAPACSFVEHLGIYGSGVNGLSVDTAVNSTATLVLQPLCPT